MAVLVWFQCYKSVTMQLHFLGVISAIQNHRNSNMHNSQLGVGINIYSPIQKLRKLSQNITHFVIFHVHCVVSKRGPWTLYIYSHYIKKGAPMFCTCYTKTFCWKQIIFFIILWKFASAWMSVSHCKLFEFIWFYIVLCLHIESCWGPPSHIFCWILKNILLASEPIKCGSRVVYQLSNKTKQKLSVKLSYWGPRHLWKKGTPRWQPSSLP